MPCPCLKYACTLRLVLLAAWLTVLAPAEPALSQTQAPQGVMPRIETNQSYIEGVSGRSDLDIGNLDAVFAYLFARLPDRVKVYPTENYYYFRFYHDGLVYAGNFRLDAMDRDKGVIDFAYFPALSGWRQDDVETYKQFGQSDGVTVEKVAFLTYKVSYAGKSVLFQLNDLSKVVPPPGLLNDDETYLGPVFDESGIQFFLVFNTRLNIFHYILNETGPVPDEIYESRVSPRIVVGRRTGFAYYKDDFKDRKILIGVYEENIIVNNYFDGPFDQLPDNFFKGSELKDAIVAAGLADADTIDRFGIYPSGDERVLVKPYMSYVYLDDLEVFSNCAHNKEIAAEYYYECFVIDDGEDDSDDSGAAPQDQQGSDDGGAEVPQPKEAPVVDQPAHKSEGKPVQQHSLARLEQSAADQTPVYTNQDFIETMLRPASLDIDDMDAVFFMVLEQLSPKVKVYPTENYYYFNFYYGGMDYSGNIRLSITNRDAGKVHFTYYKTYNGWRRDEVDKYKVFGREDGVVVEKLRDLVYRISFRGIERVFALNDLSEEKPQATMLRPGESFIGPVFDESGMQFFLLYNKDLKLFHYILDETHGVPDELYESDVSPRILIGRRTGFAFYKDKNLNRKILVGVYEQSSNVNNWLDGPFDQLPDNFIRGEALRDALVSMEPELKGVIDRYGFWDNGEARYLIGPYYYFQEVEQLALFDECATSSEMRGKYYYTCFAVGQGEN